MGINYECKCIKLIVIRAFRSLLITFCGGVGPPPTPKTYLIATDKNSVCFINCSQEAAGRGDCILPTEPDRLARTQLPGKTFRQQGTWCPFTSGRCGQGRHRFEWVANDWGLWRCPSSNEVSTRARDLNYPLSLQLNIFGSLSTENQKMATLKQIKLRFLGIF